MNDFMIMRNDSGFFVAKRVPMNNLPGCCTFFWQQVTKTYRYHAYALKQFIKLSNA